MKANMTHPPQEVLIKVMCSERLPSKEGKYIADLWLMNFYPDIDRWYRDGEPYSPEYWYEPATRIVLTEEEYKEMESERLAFKDFIQWMFDHKYSQVENVDIPSETIRFIHNRLGYANP